MGFALTPTREAEKRKHSGGVFKFGRAWIWSRVIIGKNHGNKTAKKENVILEEFGNKHGIANK